MDRAFESGAVVLAPAVPAVPSVGFPTGGNPVGGVPATKPGAHWFHMITEELRAVIVAAGLAPNPAVVDQVLQALPLALASRPEMARNLTANGYQKFPGGLILQWGQILTLASGNAVITFPITFPNAVHGIWASQQNGNLTVSVGTTSTSTASIAAYNPSAQVVLGSCWFAIGN